MLKFDHMRNTRAKIQLFGTEYSKGSNDYTFGITFGKIGNLFLFQECSMNKYSYLSLLIFCLQMFLLKTPLIWLSRSFLPTDLGQP